VGALVSGKSKAAVELGAMGGRAKSAAKTAAVRENGKKGGRPPGAVGMHERLREAGVCVGPWYERLADADGGMGGWAFIDLETGARMTIYEVAPRLGLPPGDITSWCHLVGRMLFRSEIEAIAAETGAGEVRAADEFLRRSAETPIAPR
jgi:hypothetical protein